MGSDRIISNYFLSIIMILCIIPFLLMFYYSFIEIINGKEVFSLNGIGELFSSIRLTELSTIIVRSLLVSLIATIFSFLLSYLIFKKAEKKFRIIFLTIITIPLLINESVRVFSWQLLLSENGIFNSTLSFLFGGVITLFNGSNNNNALFVMLISTIPFGIFINTASLTIIPKIYWKVSNDIGLSQFVTFLRIVLPLSKMSIIITFFVSFFLAFSLSSEINFLGGDSKISIRNLVLSLMSSGNFSAIFLLGSSLLLLIFFLSIGFKLLNKK